MESSSLTFASVSPSPCPPSHPCAGTLRIRTSPPSSFVRTHGLTPSGSASGGGISSSSSRRRMGAFARASLAFRDSGRDERSGLLDTALKGLAALTLSAFLQLSPVAQASEFNILGDGPPKESHVVDDAGVLSRLTKSDLKRLLTDLEERKGFHIDMVTLRKLTSKADVFEFADQVLERWYPTIEEGNNKGLVLLVTTQKEGAVTGGPAFIKAAGDAVLESVVSENLPVLASDEKYNEALYSSAKRLAAVIDGLPDPGGPKFQETKRESNFKTREETEEKRGQFTTVVGGLLVIAFVVPMAQYYAYVSKK